MKPSAKVYHQHIQMSHDISSPDQKRGKDTIICKHCDTFSSRPILKSSRRVRRRRKRKDLWGYMYMYS